jgi:hypothetical protein
MDDQIETIIGYLPKQILEDEEYYGKHFIVKKSGLYSCENNCIKLPKNSIITSAIMYYCNDFDYERMGLHHEMNGSLILIKENLVNCYQEGFMAAELNKKMFKRFVLINSEIDLKQKEPIIYIEYTLKL